MSKLSHTQSRKHVATESISVVVPTYNEAPNVLPLVTRIADAMQKAQTSYEIIFIDDRSTDGTPDIIQSLKKSYPVHVYTKQGVQGKAYSLIEGFVHARYPRICMIDGDLQYPPEAIPGMSALLNSENADIVQTRRVDNNTTPLRKFVTRGFNFVFAQMLFGIKFDTQSGLKLFKKEVLAKVDLQPGAWTFDLDFLVKSMQQGFKVVSYDIKFSERLHGEAKINVFTAATEMAVDSVKLKLQTTKIGRFQASNKFQKITVRNVIVASIVAAATIMGASNTVNAVSIQNIDSLSSSLTKIVYEQSGTTGQSNATSPNIGSASSVAASPSTTQAIAATSGSTPVSAQAPTTIVPATAPAVGYHGTDPTTSDAYNGALRQAALQRGAALEHTGVIIFKIGIAVMLAGATMYAITKFRKYTGNLATQ
jgi:dolichol-phosphate mannosyltransferase